VKSRGGVIAPLLRRDLKRRLNAKPPGCKPGGKHCCVRFNLPRFRRDQRGFAMIDIHERRTSHKLSDQGPLTGIDKRVGTEPARTRNLTCRRCGKPIVHRAGRRPTYCSDRCRLREFDRRRVKKACLGGDTGGPTKRAKLASKINALQRAKIRSSTPILGPSNVIGVEVFGGRAWKPLTSAGGVTGERAQLRPRVLIDARLS
jgi:hypothetical protein